MRWFGGFFSQAGWEVGTEWFVFFYIFLGLLLLPFAPLLLAELDDSFN